MITLFCVWSQFCAHAQVVATDVLQIDDDGGLLLALDAADFPVVSVVAGISRPLLSGALLFQLAAARDRR